jgi:hypothetical protein
VALRLAVKGNLNRKDAKTRGCTEEKGGRPHFFLNVGVIDDLIDLALDG